MAHEILSEVLADPETHEPVSRATDAQLEAIRRAMADGKARKHAGGPLPEAVEGAWVSHGGAWIYPDTQGFPSLLVEERIELEEPV